VHGSGRESVRLERLGMGSLRPHTVYDDGGGTVSQRHYYSGDGGGADEGEHCRRFGV